MFFPPGSAGWSGVTHFTDLRMNRTRNQKPSFWPNQMNILLKYIFKPNAWFSPIELSSAELSSASESESIQPIQINFGWPII